jgi:hypothetical protein
MSRNKESQNRAVVLAVVLANYATEKQGQPLSPYVAAALVRQMQAAALGAKRRAIHACNYPMTEAEEAKAALWHERMAARINASLEAQFINQGRREAAPVLSLGNSDPRGPCAWLHVPGVPGDGFPSDLGFAVF